MTISRVGTAAANATSVALPAHQAGDLIIVAAWRDGYTATPLAAAAGWPLITLRSAGQFTFAIAAKIATSAAEVSGTWTGATQIIAAVYRHSANHLVVGQVTGANAGSSTINYPGFAQASAVTDRWAVAFAGAILNTTDIETAPTGLANVTSIAGASAGELVLHDSGANIAWTTNRTVTINTSTQHGENVFEVVDSGVPKAAVGGMLIHPGMSGGMRG